MLTFFFNLSTLMKIVTIKDTTVGETPIKYTFKKSSVLLIIVGPTILDIPTKIPQIPNKLTEFSTPNLFCTKLGNKTTCPEKLKTPKQATIK